MHFARLHKVITQNGPLPPVVLKHQEIASLGRRRGLIGQCVIAGLIACPLLGVKAKAIIVYFSLLSAESLLEHLEQTYFYLAIGSSAPLTHQVTMTIS